MDEDAEEVENFKMNPITENERKNNIQLENVMIKMELNTHDFEEGIEESFDNLLVNKDDIKIDFSQNDIKLTSSTIKKENVHQDIQENLHEKCTIFLQDNILEMSDSEIDATASKLEENNDPLYLEKCSGDPLANLKEMKIDIVDNDIETLNSEINIQYKSKDNVNPLEHQDENYTDKDIKEEYLKENNIDKIEIFTKWNEDTIEEENFELNPIREFKTGNNPISLKLIESRPNNMQLGNVIIKMEPKNQNTEENIDNIEINQNENKFDVSQNDVKITASIKKENENQDFKEHFQERFDNIWETCDSENDYMETKEKENYDYPLFSEKCTDDPSINLDEIKIDIVDNDIESVNNEIYIKYKNENNEKFLTEVNVTPLKDQIKDKTDKEANFIYKSLEGKQKQISLIKRPKQQKKCDVVNQKVKIVKNHECTICKKNFLQSSSLNNHMRIHTGEKPHECSVCQKKFKHLSTLKMHLKIHTGVKPHECTVCQKKFTHSSDLKKHMRIHTGVKPYECVVCQKKFTHSFTLKDHLKIHNGVKPHECSVCQKKFTQSSALKEHLNIHTGVKPHACSVCQKKFTHLSSMKMHLKIHTEVKPHECRVCQKKFIRSSNLKQHLKIHNRVKSHECSV